MQDLEEKQREHPVWGRRQEDNSFQRWDITGLVLLYHLHPQNKSGLKPPFGGKSVCCQTEQATLLVW